MRTTISIDDDLHEDLKTYARANGISFGRAVVSILRRELQPQPKIVVENGFPVVHLPGAPPVTSEQIRKILDEEPW